MTSWPGRRAAAALAWRLVSEVSLAEWRHHPWRTVTAWFAILLGVALAFSVHLINESALGEFSAAVRQVNAQPDLELRGPRSGFDEAWYSKIAAHPAVAAASPVVEVDTYALAADGKRIAIRVLGIDALQAFALAPHLMPQPREGAPRLAMLDPQHVFLNAAATSRLDTVRGVPIGQPPSEQQPQGETNRQPAGAPADVVLQSGSRWLRWTVQGSVAASGPQLAVMDIAGAQEHFDRLGRLTRIDVRLVPGADRDAFLRDLALPAGVRAVSPDEAAQRVSNLSRAYRVNLTVLALVALFTGAFLVFSILALSVAQRMPQLALMAVIGLSARERRLWILLESALLGIAGSLAGLAVGTALAWVGLRVLAGDLGGAYFPGVRPSLQFSGGAAAAYGALGVVAALVGGWMPARAAATMAPAQALKGLGATRAGHPADAGAPLARISRLARMSRLARRLLAGPAFGPALLAAGAAMAFAPPIAGLPLAAYGSVALLLLGGIACVPTCVRLLVDAVVRLAQPLNNPLALLAVERARHERDTATVAVAGVVASLSLAVALTVMVASFRGSIIDWLDTVLPADLYVRTATGAAAAEAAFIDEPLIERIARLPGVTRLEAVRQTQVPFDPNRPPVAIVARPMAQPEEALPWVGALLPLRDQPADTAVVYVSEAMVNLYGAKPGTLLTLPLPDGREARAWVRGVWRDYARQHGAVVIARADFERLTGDNRVNDLALWLEPEVDAGRVQADIRQLMNTAGKAAGGPASSIDAGAAPVEFATPGEIRQLSMRIFDRSFAVTYWLQAVAIGIGLFGIAASFSAQVLARRKEFGLLAHLGLTRRQILTIVAAEGVVWTTAGALLGLALGLAVSLVLVHVVNPQSFHWTMQLEVPLVRLAMLAGAVVLAGTVTAWWAGRTAARRDLALAVKEDW